MKDIQNGSLYVNQTNNQILRVRSKANSNSVLATYEDDQYFVYVQGKGEKLPSKMDEATANMLFHNLFSAM